MLVNLFFQHITDHHNAGYTLFYKTDDKMNFHAYQSSWLSSVSIIQAYGFTSLFVP